MVNIVRHVKAVLSKATIKLMQEYFSRFPSTCGSIWGVRRALRGQAIVQVPSSVRGSSYQLGEVWI